MFSENLKTLRKNKGFSQEQLSVRLNVVRQTISKWEKGLSVPDAEMFEEAFYGKKDLDPQLRKNESGENIMTVPEGVDAELLAKVLANPEMAALLTSLAKTMK